MRILSPKIYRLALLVTAFLISVPDGLAFAKSQRVFAKEKLVQAEKIWLGQRLSLYVTLYTITSFTGPTHFVLPKVSGMLIMENEDRPFIGTEKIDGLSYIFKRYEIVLFPLHSGNLTIPGFTVDFSFRGETGKALDHSFTTLRHQFNVLKIPGLNSRKPVISTTNFKLNDQWNPEPGKVKVGDALIRTITMFADDLPGMVLPPLDLKKIDGLGFYARQPQVEDQRQRGEFSGKRTETITYVCEQKGTFTIPGLGIQLWNPETETLREVSLKAVEFEVAANPLLEKESPAGTIRTNGRGFPWKWVVLILLFSALVVVALFRFYLKKKQSGTGITDQEKEFFDKFQKAAASQNAAVTIQALINWLDHSKLTGTSVTLARFSALAGNPELDKQIRSLETTLYAAKPDTQWSGKKLSIAVRQARKNLRRQALHIKQHRLPALNP